MKSDVRQFTTKSATNHTAFVGAVQNCFVLGFTGLAKHLVILERSGQTWSTIYCFPLREACPEPVEGNPPLRVPFAGPRYRPVAGFLPYGRFTTKYFTGSEQSGLASRLIVA